MKRTTAEETIADYRRELEQALEALGSAEAKEVSGEVASHLEDARADDRLEAYLAEIGPPETFAAGLLAERGLLPGEAVVPEAARWRRSLAVVVDIVVGIAPVLLAFSVASMMIAPTSDGRVDPIYPVVAWSALAAAAAWGLYYWLRRTRRAGRTSVGMAMADLRPVRVGKTVRVVRAAELTSSDSGAWHRVGAFIRFGLAFLVTLFIVFAVVSWLPARETQMRQGAISAAAMDVASAMSVTNEVVLRLQAGAPVAELAQLVDETAATQLPAIAQRWREGGPVDAPGFLLDMGEPIRYDDENDPMLSDATIVVTATPRGGLMLSVRATVRKDVVQRDANSFQTDYRIVAIEPGG